MRLTRLDGIRAIAILMVIGRHGILLPYGWAGVDLFFVLSGFLITGILRRERDQASFFGPFYVKRATRILPPMLIAIAAGFLLFPVPWRHMWAYYLFFAANIAQVYHPDEVFSLGVLWSLAVEEHFYLLWPLAVRYLNRQQLIRTLVAVLVLEPVARGVATPFLHSDWPIWYLTPFRLDAIAAGCLLAILLEDEKAAAVLRAWSGRAALGLTALFILLLVVFPSFRRENNLIPFNALGASFLAGIGVFFVAYVALREDSRVSRLLASPVPAFIGLISYGMYLFHPILMLPMEQRAHAIHLRHSNPIVTLIALPATIAISWLSFRWYERPLTTWGQRKAKAMHAEAIKRSAIAT